MSLLVNDLPNYDWKKQKNKNHQKLGYRKHLKNNFFPSYFKNLIGGEGGTLGEGGPVNQLKKCQIKYLKNMFAEQ